MNEHRILLLNIIRSDEAIMKKTMSDKVENRIF